MAILSIQSHVAYGHVGNRSAVFPLERMGFEVWPINTVQFSNHTGYGSWKGEVYAAHQLSLMWRGLVERGVIGACEAVLSGYMGSADVGRFILGAVEEVKAERPDALYCCDPVMGDYGRGFFVAEGIPAFMRESAVALADIVTPNQFEAEILSGASISSVDDAKRACERIHALGPSIILVTSFKPEGARDSSISMFLSSSEGFRIVTTPEIPIDPPLNGAGDLCSALFLGHYLADRDPALALELMADSVFSIFERSRADGARELSLVAAQDAIASPGRRFVSVRV